jgi:hypothetical protein
MLWINFGLMTLVLPETSQQDNTEEENQSMRSIVDLLSSRSEPDDISMIFFAQVRRFANAIVDTAAGGGRGGGGGRGVLMHSERELTIATPAPRIAAAAPAYSVLLYVVS